MRTMGAQFRPVTGLEPQGRSGAPGWLVVFVVLIAVTFLAGCKRHSEAGGKGHDEPATVAFVALPPAPKPIGTLPANATCVTPECHSRFKTAAHIHGPVALAACSSCHQADQGGHKFPLIRKGNDLCTFCHVVAGTKLHQHKALEENVKVGSTAATQPAPQTAAASQPADASSQAAGTVPGARAALPPGSAGCLNCHDPHVSKAKFLLTADTVDAVCAKCHDVPLKKHAHQPFAAGQCTVCHQAHQSEYKSLLRNGDGPDHCYSCHKDKQAQMTQSLDVHKPAAQSCTSCHGPHATDYSRQLKAPVNDNCLGCHPKVKQQIATAKHEHGALVEGNCASCHDPHASNQPAQLKARTDKVCLTCHEKAIKTADGRTIAAMGGVLASKNLHGPVKAGSCSDCHLPHAGDQPNLLKQYFPDTFYAKFDVQNYALCFSCHNQQMVLQSGAGKLTNFRDGDKNLHFVHVNREDKGRSCRTCHDVHGSDLPNHMAATVPFEGSSWPMPMNYEKSDNGGSCTPGCHATKTYDRTKSAGAPATGGKP